MINDDLVAKHTKYIDTLTTVTVGSVPDDFHDNLDDPWANLYNVGLT